MNNKKIVGIGMFLAFLGFFVAYGIVGSLDNNAITLKEGIIGVSFGFALMISGGLVTNKGGSRVD